MTLHQRTRQLQVAQETRRMAAQIVGEEGEHPEPEAGDIAEQDPEALLYKRAGLKRPELHAKAPAEFAIQQQEYGDKNDHQLLVEIFKANKAGSGGALAAYRGIRNMRATLKIHSVTLVNLQNDMKKLQRVLARFDMPIKPSEGATNPVRLL